MAVLTGADVMRGDIFICKSFALVPNPTHYAIRKGQEKFYPGESYNSVHAQIALTTGEDPVELVESTGKGIGKAGCDVEAYVFRLRRAYPNNRQLADQAGDVAERLYEWAKDRTTSGGQAAGRYNTWRSLFSVARDKSYGPQAQARVKEVESALDGNGDYEDGFFCSMLATVCYQVAADELKLPRPPIEADAMNMNPSGLEEYMRQHKDVWACIGIYNRPDGNVFGRWARRLFVND